MKKWIILIVALLAGGGAGYYYWSTRTSDEKRAPSSELYTCPMHPNIIRDKPGTCPICGMTLVPMHTHLPEHQHHEKGFYLSPERLQLIGVKTAEVIAKPLQQEIRLSGRVAFDQDLYVTEKEYTQAITLGAAGDVRKAIEKKLDWLGVSDEELARLKKTRRADESLFLPEEKGPIWVYASVYESDLSLVSPGMTAQIEIPSSKEIALEGVVKQVEPTVDSATRTAQARILVSKNLAGLKPESYVNVVLKKDLGAVLAVPADAVLDTGVRQVVLVDLGEGYLEPRPVKLGVKAGGDYPVAEGLEAGEKVITSAQFLLDSESQIQEALKQFGEPMPAGHQH